MDDLALQEPLSADYSDFGEEFERLMLKELADVTQGREAKDVGH
ncbi:hypothetical protein [Hyphomicrobium sp. MC1]|nr:hypothetical protein [Hyphomicrobium sp. MC1]CCB64063.1 protein of unknown function [Hyphomicrobium sp. MC1]